MHKHFYFKLLSPPFFFCKMKHWLSLLKRQLKSVYILKWALLNMYILNNFHVFIYPWLGGEYQDGAEGVWRNIEEPPIVFVFPKLKFIFLSKEM